MANVQQENRERYEGILLKMMVQEIERGDYRPGSTFSEESKQYVFGKFRSKYGGIYSNRFLKSRIRSIRESYQVFSKMMNNPQLHWRKKDNVVWGNEELLRANYACRYNKDRGVYTGECNFDLMREVFESGVEFKA